MKKILIGTSAIVAAVAFAGAAQAADPIKLSIGGYGSFAVGYAAQADGFWTGASRQNPENNSVDVKGSNEVHFKGSTKLDNGLTVSAKYEMEAGGTGATRSDPTDEYNISVSGAFGTIIAGADDTALDIINVGAPTVNGRLTDGGNSVDDTVYGGDWIARPGSAKKLGLSNDGVRVLADHFTASSDAESISYLTPSFAGFTFGATYIADATADDDAGALVNKGQEGYGVGVLYKGEFSGVGIAADAGWATADLDKRGQFTIDSYNTYQLGAAVTYAGFAFGGNVVWLDYDAGTQDLTDVTWSVGASYKTGPYGVSLTYIDGYGDNGVRNAARGLDYEDDRAQVIELTGLYNMGPGVDLNAMIGYAAFSDGNAQVAGANANEGVIVLSGMTLAF